mmetsp:Transcript_76/g.249  ORF Transcript_76/g.249 Transcript_76/m.249 type:complete len:273 (-) Transcript_76:952-1770(-)
MRTPTPALSSDADDLLNKSDKSAAQLGSCRIQDWGQLCLDQVRREHEAGKSNFWRQEGVKERPVRLVRGDVERDAPVKAMHLEMMELDVSLDRPPLHVVAVAAAKVHSVESWPEWGDRAQRSQLEVRRKVNGVVDVVVVHELVGGAAPPHRALAPEHDVGVLLGPARHHCPLGDERDGRVALVHAPLQVLQNAVLVRLHVANVHFHAPVNHRVERIEVQHLTHVKNLMRLLLVEVLVHAGVPCDGRQDQGSVHRIRKNHCPAQDQALVPPAS